MKPNFKRLRELRRREAISKAKHSDTMTLELVGKKSIRFSLVYTPTFFDTASRIPTGRQNREANSYEYQPTPEVWKALKPYLLAGLIIPTGSAQVILDRLGAQYRETRRKIRAATVRFKAVEDTQVVIPMKSRAYDHQARAFGFATTLDSCALLMEQGTGKTYVAMAASGHRYRTQQVRRLLVVTVKAAVHVWEDQFKEHTNFPYSMSASTGGGAFVPPDAHGLEVVVINYHRAFNIRKALLKWGADMVVVDESQKIKNRSTKISKILAALGKRARYKMILTGTPLGQSPLDAWAQYRFVDESILGSNYRVFEDRYAVKGGYMGFEIKGYKNLDELAERVHSVSFRCTKDECLDLPARTFQRLYVEADAKTRRIYRELDLEFMTELAGQEISVDRRVAAITKLRQLTSGLIRTDAKQLIPVSEAKLSALKEYAEDRDWSRKLVVFTVFNHEMDIIGEAFRKMGISFLTLHGGTKNRGETVRRFQTSKRDDSILVQVQTGGAAIDLFAANAAVFYSPTFSFIDYAQAKDRIHRIGQDSPCTYLNLLMRGTVDEDIAKILETAGDMSTMILDAKRNYRLKRSKLR